MREGTMGDVKISKTELVLLSAAIDKIVSSEVLEKVITETLPKNAKTL